MAILIDKTQPVRKVLDSDKDLPPEEQTIFLFRPLTLRALANVERHFDGLSKNPNADDTIKLMSEILGLVLMDPGWENLKDPRTGSDYEYSKAISEQFELFPMTLINEVIETALKLNRLTEEEKGNSK